MPYSNGINTSIIESMSMIDNGSLITLTRDKEISKFLIFPSSIKRQRNFFTLYRVEFFFQCHGYMPEDKPYRAQ